MALADSDRLEVRRQERHSGRLLASPRYPDQLPG